MTAARITRRLTALGLLVGAVLVVAFAGSSMARNFLDGQREIAEKQAALRTLRELAAARSAFEHLMPRKGSTAPVLPSDGDAPSLLQTALSHAAEGQQVIVDAVDPLPPEPVTRTAMVHLRGTQAGLYAFLKGIEESIPYLLVPRLEVTPSRAADLDHGKPFIVSADLRLSVLVAPPTPVRRKTPGSEPAS